MRIERDSEERSWAVRVGSLINFSFSKGILEGVARDPETDRIVLIVNTGENRWGLNRLYYVDEIEDSVVLSETDLILWKLENEDME